MVIAPQAAPADDGSLSDTLWLWGAAAIVFLLIAVLFPAGRKLIAVMFGALLAGLYAVLHFLLAHLQRFVLTLGRAHATVVKNFMPRSYVLPNVRNDKTVRRD